MFPGEYINGPKDSDEEMAFSQNPEQGEAQSIHPEPSPWLEGAGETMRKVLCSKKLTLLRVRDPFKKEVPIDIFIINYSNFFHNLTSNEKNYFSRNLIMSYHEFHKGSNKTDFFFFKLSKQASI